MSGVLEDSCTYLATGRSSRPWLVAKQELQGPRVSLLPLLHSTEDLKREIFSKITYSSIPEKDTTNQMALGNRGPGTQRTCLNRRSRTQEQGTEVLRNQKIQRKTPDSGASVSWRKILSRSKGDVTKLRQWEAGQLISQRTGNTLGR